MLGYYSVGNMGTMRKYLLYNEHWNLMMYKFMIETALIATILTN